MRFFFLIAVFFCLTTQFLAQDSTSFFRHLSVDGKIGITYLDKLRMNDDYRVDKGEDRETDFPTKGNVNFDNGINLNLSVDYSFRPNFVFRKREFKNFLILGITGNLSSFKYNVKYQDLVFPGKLSYHTISYNPNELTGRTTPIELGLKLKYLLKGKHLVVGPNVGFGIGTFLMKRTTNILTTSYYYEMIPFYGEKTTVSQRTIGLNNYFWKKNFGFFNFGLMIGKRFENYVLFIDGEFEYASYYKYLRCNVGIKYLL